MQLILIQFDRNVKFSQELCLLSNARFRPMQLSNYQFKSRYSVA